MLYKCDICEKEFKQKSHYIDHLNRIRPCVKLTDESSKNPQITSKIPQNSSKTLKKICHYCGYETERKDNYNRHLLSCKIRKRDIEEKEEILNKLLEQNNKLVSTIEELNKRIDKLENEKKTNQIQNNKNVKHQNNGTINNTINIIGFGKEDLSRIDNKEFFEALTQMGYKIPAKMVEKIHINDKYPEYKNIYISDINRGKAMVYDGKKWKLDKYNNISDKLLDKILNFMEERYEDIKDDKKITDKKKTNMENKLKILQIMKDYEEEEEKERHEYLRNQCKDKIKMDLYNNREGENPKAEEDGKS
jgi:DNA-directed RNA polymerase subunit RPC12/RpoP